MPPSARSNQPLRVRDRAGEACRARGRRARSRRARSGSRRSSRAGTARAARRERVVDRARDDLLARAGLAEDEHRRVGGRPGRRAPSRRAARRLADDRVGERCGVSGVAARGSPPMRASRRRASSCSASSFASATAIGSSERRRRASPPRRPSPAGCPRARPRPGRALSGRTIVWPAPGSAPDGPRAGPRADRVARIRTRARTVPAARGRRVEVTRNAPPLRPRSRRRFEPRRVSVAVDRPGSRSAGSMAPIDSCSEVPVASRPTPGWI